MDFPPAEIDFAAGKLRIETPQGVHVEDLPAAFQDLETSFHTLRLDVGADRMKILLPGSVESKSSWVAPRAVMRNSCWLAERSSIWIRTAGRRWRRGATACVPSAPQRQPRRSTLPSLSPTEGSCSRFRPVTLSRRPLSMTISCRSRLDDAGTQSRLAGTASGGNPRRGTGSLVEGGKAHSRWIREPGRRRAVRDPLREVDASQIPGPMAAVFARIVNLSSVYETLDDRKALPAPKGDRLPPIGRRSSPISVATCSPMA